VCVRERERERERVSECECECGYECGEGRRRGMEDNG
jgi:hypothetical protein